MLGNNIFLIKEIFNNKIILFYLLTCTYIGIYVYSILKHSNIASPRRLDLEKTSSYECGFNPYIQTRTKFDFKFYIISIIFLVFDMEIILLLPISLLLLLGAGMTVILTYLFLFVLVLGLIIEYNANLFLY